MSSEIGNDFSLQVHALSSKRRPAFSCTGHFSLLTLALYHVYADVVVVAALDAVDAGSVTFVEAAAAALSVGAAEDAASLAAEDAVDAVFVAAEEAADAVSVAAEEPVDAVSAAPLVAALAPLL